jgi:hypothetical protein
MRVFWIGLFLITLGWDGLSPHIDQPSAQLAIFGLGLGGLLLLKLPERSCPSVPRFLSLVLGSGSALAAGFLPWPEALGPSLLAGGAFLSSLPLARSAVLAAPTRALLASGGLVSAFAVAAPLYRSLEASRHDLPWTAPLLASFLRLLGIPASSDGHFVHLQGVGHLVSFDCTLEKLIGHEIALLLVAGFGWTLAFHRGSSGRRLLLRIASCAGAYFVLRAVALALLIEDNKLPSIYYARAWVFATTLPLVLLLTAFVPLVPRPREDREEATARELHEESPPEAHVSPAKTRALFAALGLAALLGASLAGFLGFYAPGKPKGGRVVIDERHSNWEWSTIELNTTSYGVQTVYNYSELVRYLRYFYDVRQNYEPFTDELLAGVDVLILKTPTRPYEDEEVEALVRFVGGGGGLWLIGDHTNVFGMSANLNKVGERFGISYLYNAVIDLRTFGRQLYRRPRLFAHPSVRHLPPLLMATSSSMTAPPFARRVMLGRSLLADWLDYSVNSFFGDFQPQSSESFGCMLQAVAIEEGRGRVLGFSDSTIFSNFFMFIRGKPELALGSVAWLMHENEWRWVRLSCGVASLAALAAFLALSRGMPRLVMLAALAALALPSFVLTARGLDAWVASFSQLPAPRSPLPSVAFERGRTDYEIPDIYELHDKDPRSFHTFYVWTQRVGHIPRSHLFERCLDSSVLVLVNPRAPFDAAEKGALKSYVENGGGLLVLDTPHSKSSTANSLLEPFGLAFEHVEIESTLVREAASPDSLGTLHHLGTISGGDPVIVLPDERAVLAKADFGKGRVVAFCGADNFSNESLGATSDVPNAHQLFLYELEFKIFRELLPPGGPSVDRNAFQNAPAGG